MTQPITDQIKQAKVGDIAELRCGGRVAVIEVRDDRTLAVKLSGDMWVFPNGHRFLMNESPFDIIAIHPAPKQATIKERLEDLKEAYVEGDASIESAIPSLIDIIIWAQP